MSGTHDVMVAIAAGADVAGWVLVVVQLVLQWRTGWRSRLGMRLGWVACGLFVGSLVDLILAARVGGG